MRRILIVDDEKTFLKSLVVSLELSDTLKGIACLTATNGREALDVLESTHVDLIITDIMMPVMDGFEFLGQLNQTNKEIPVIVMTAFGSPDIQKRVSRLGAVRYVDKPIKIPHLIQQIQQTFNDTAKGTISGIQLSDFMQIIYMGQKSCTLEVISSDKIGRLYFWAGELIDAEYENCNMDGRDAALEIVTWEDVTIKLKGNYQRSKNKVNTSINALLMEGMRRKDEKESKDFDECDTSGSNFEQPVVAAAEPLDISELASENFNLKPESSSQSITIKKEEGIMASQEQIDALLAKLDEIDGAHGGTLVNKEGMIIASRLDKRYAKDKIAALTTSVIKTATKVIVEAGFGKPDSMLIEGTDGKMCVINATKGGFFISLIGDKELNIGMARIGLQEAIDAFDELH